jgi:hypothetical protein
MAVEVLPTPPFDVEIAILFNVYFLLLPLSRISNTGSQGKRQRTGGFGSAIFLDFLYFLPDCVPIYDFSLLT